MRPRHTALLTPLESAVPISILISILNAPITSLESALTSHSQLIENTATLSLAESALTNLSPATSLKSALTKTPGVGGEADLLSPQVSPRTKGIRSRQSGPLFLPHQSPITSHGSPIPLSPTAQTTTPSRMYIVPVLSSPLCIRGIALSFRVGGYHE